MNEKYKKNLEKSLNNFQKRYYSMDAPAPQTYDEAAVRDATNWARDEMVRTEGFLGPESGRDRPPKSKSTSPVPRDLRPYVQAIGKPPDELKLNKHLAGGVASGWQEPEFVRRNFPELVNDGDSDDVLLSRFNILNEQYKRSPATDLEEFKKSYREPQEDYSLFLPPPRAAKEAGWGDEHEKLRLAAVDRNDAVKASRGGIEKHNREKQGDLSTQLRQHTLVDRSFREGMYKKKMGPDDTHLKWSTGPDSGRGPTDTLDLDRESGQGIVGTDDKVPLRREDVSQKSSRVRYSDMGNVKMLGTNPPLVTRNRQEYFRHRDAMPGAQVDEVGLGIANLNIAAQDDSDTEMHDVDSS